MEEKSDQTTRECTDSSSRIITVANQCLTHQEPVFPKARVLIPSLIVFQILAFLLSDFYGSIFTSGSSEEYEALDWLFLDLVQTFLYLGFAISLCRFSLHIFFKAPMSHTNYLETVNWTLFLFAFSWMTALLLFIPLSYVAPDFVEMWYFSSYATFPEGSDDKTSIWASVIMFLSIVVFAPVFEEIFFRGFLLRRWQQKWNTRVAIIVSSVLFGLLHSDPIGATAFGVIMCLLYLKTKTLFVPMFAHFLNNLIAWLITGAEAFYFPSDNYEIADLQQEWKIMIGLLILCIFWFVFILRSTHNPFNWK